MKLQKIDFDLLQATTLTLVGLLLFEDMPWTLLGSCIASNVAYYFVLQTFPFIQLTSPVFIVSLGKFSPLDIVIFHVSRRQREMYCGDARLCVCTRPHAYTVAWTRM